MAFQNVNVGTVPNDGTGDTIRDAFTKVNSNFSSLNSLNLDGLADPGGDRALFWDDSANTLAWLQLGTLLSISGTTINVSSDSSKLDVAGGTLTGVLTLDSDPTNPLEAATKQYADTKLDLAGGNLTGPLTLNEDPSGPFEAATKQYVDAVATGLDPKASCRLATTTNHGLSGLANVDGVTPQAGDRVLVKNQTTGSENGIYIAASGSWNRALDADEDGDVTSGMHCLVTEGNTHVKQGFILTTADPITVGTTNLVFEQYSDISGTPTATETVLGGLEVGTQAEVDAGTLDNKIVTPAKLKNWPGSSNITALGAVSSVTSINMADNQIIRPEFKDYAETLVSSNTGTSFTIDLVNGNIFELTLTGNCTFSFSNPPASGKGGCFSLLLKQDGTGGRTTTWPGSVKWAGGVVPSLSAAANAIDILTFVTTDGGTNWFGFLGGANFS